MTEVELTIKAELERAYAEMWRKIVPCPMCGKTGHLADECEAPPPELLGILRAGRP
jgi:hypothetical protein